MASQQSKVLRIGIIQDGKIVQERLVKAGESVTVGESAKNTFVFPKTHLKVPEFTLFASSSKGYTLQFTEGMKGKISSGGAVVALQKLSQDPSVKKQGEVYALPLTPQDRGKLSVDAITVLFQFVAPPPVKAVKPMQAMDFRPRMIEDDDPVFLGFLAIWSALAVVLMIYVANTEPREFVLQEIPDRFTRMVVAPKEKPEIEPELLETEGAEVAQREKEVKPEPADKGNEAKKETETEAAARKEQLKEDVVQKSKLLMKIIGTTGDNSRGVVENLWSNEEQGLGDIDAALQATGGVTTDAGEALRSGSGKGERADIGDLGSAGSGTAVVGTAPVFKTSVSAGEGSLESIEGDRGKVSAVIKSNAGQLKYCYENRLKSVPNLQGRVEVGWSINGGKASGVYLIANSTGDAELADCIIKKIGRWTFPADSDGDIDSWPFVFQASKG